MNIPCYRGSLNNVLSRYYQAAKQYELDVILRVTSDCPFFMPLIADEIIKSHVEQGYDFSSTALDRVLPYGLDMGVVNFNVLEEANKNATHSFEKEHVMPYIYKSNPNKFKINRFKPSQEFCVEGLRLTLDTPEDYTLCDLLYQRVFDRGSLFSWKEVLDVLRNFPGLENINRSVVQKQVFKSLDEELNHLGEYCQTQDLKMAVDWLKKNR